MNYINELLSTPLGIMSLVLAGLLVLVIYLLRGLQDKLNYLTRKANNDSQVMAEALDRVIYQNEELSRYIQELDDKVVELAPPQPKTQEFIREREIEDLPDWLKPYVKDRASRVSTVNFI